MTATRLGVGGAGRQPDGSIEAALLCRVLANGFGEARGVDLTERLLARYGSIAACLAAPSREVVQTVGAEGESCARLLEDLQSLFLSLLRTRLRERPLLSSRTLLHRYLINNLAHERREQFRVLHLDGRHGLIAEEVMASGDHNHAAVYPREVARRALDLGSSALILVHNHPCGDPSPSLADIETTEKIVAGCAVFGVEVHDHIVVGRGRIFSFRVEGLMPMGATTFEHSEWLLKRRPRPRPN